jgi:iron complex transport system substrate-binding protein
MRPGRLSALLPSLLALVASVVCAADTRQVSDATGRNINIPEKITRVYAAGPPASVFVFALAPDKLAGWTRALRPQEEIFLPKKYWDLPELGRLTGRGNTANVEVILAAKPDLIVDAGSVAPTFVSLAERVREQTGIPYLLYDGSFARTAETFRDLGVVLGEEARGKLLAKYIENTLAAIDKKIATVPADKRPRVYYARTPSGLQTALQGSINVEVLDVLGTVNVAGKGPGGLTNVSLEQVLDWNPDVIVTTDPNFYAQVYKDPRWGSIAALKAKRVYLSPHLPFCWFDFPPGPNRIVGLHWLAKILYPDLFKEDLRPKVKEFYRLFYHREPSDEMLEALFADGTVK